MIGCVSAFLAILLGNLIGLVSVGFLDRFTLFEYGFELNWLSIALVACLCIATCIAASLYPAMGAAKVAGAEALHYE